MPPKNRKQFDTFTMNENEINILASKLAEKLLFQPRWMKLKQACKYACIHKERLKELANNGDIIGYSDPVSRRGDWIFDRESIDEFRLKPVMETNLRVKEIIDKIEGYL